MRSPILISALACLLATAVATEQVFARGGGRGGGGGGGRGGGGGGARAGGGGGGASMSRPSSGMNRTPTMSRPQASTRPSTGAGQRTGGNVNQRPTGSGNLAGSTRPSTSRPGSSTRPGQVGNQRPGNNRPGDATAGNRPGTRPGTRPSAGDVGSFLGLASPVAADRLSGDRRSGDRLSGDRADGSRRAGEDASNRRDNREAFSSDFASSASDRADQRQDWGSDVRNDWQDNRQDFWNDHFDDLGEPGWRADYPHLAHGYYHYNHPYAHGWATWATAATVGSWFVAGGEPVYYDYGTGGNVYYEDETVYVNDEAMPATDYAAQAQEIAATGAQSLEAPLPAGQEEEWLPLGVFTLSTSPDEKTSTRTMQLAINKQGVINGTFMNTAIDKELPIFGQVDPKTQRACWYIGENSNVVMETGIYNLTKDQTSVLIHFDQERTEEYLLVRLDPPAAGKTAKDGSNE